MAAGAGHSRRGDRAAEAIAARLDGWLIQHLVTVFGLPGKLAHALVTEGRILLVLDGLDEMDIDDTRPRRAAAVIRALNHPSAGGLRPVVITCRTTRYQQLNRPPHSADDARPVRSGIRIQPRPTTEVVRFQPGAGVAKEPEWNNKFTELSIIAGQGLRNTSKWVTYFISATKVKYERKEV